MKTMRTGTTRRNALALVALCAGVCSGGCVNSGYSNWPPTNASQAFDGDSAGNNVNAPPMPQVEATALNYASRRFPPAAGAQPGDLSDAPFAVNLPPGTTLYTGRFIIERVSPTANLLTPATDSLPTYHIARIEIRGSDALVQVMVPVVGMKTGTGEPLYRGVTIKMQGGFQNWKVISHASFPVGVLDVPERNYFPEAPVPGPRMPVAAPRPAETDGEAAGEK